MKRIYKKQVSSPFDRLIQHCFDAKVIISCCLIFLVASCDSFVEVDPPQSEIVGEVIFEELGTANAALSALYTGAKDRVLLTGGFSGVGYLMGLYADELDYFASPGTFPGFFHTNSVLPTGSQVTSVWSNAYNLIYQANAIIEGIDNSNSLIQEDKNQIKGEALFIRACIHFYLVNMYGNVPYIATTDYRVNTVAERISLEDVYIHIISDLNEAKSLLTDEYVVGERIRVNKGTVSALLARTYLYMEDWDNAQMESTAVIDQYIWEPDVNKVFLKESTSAIWQLKPTLAGQNTAEAGIFIFDSAPPPNIALTNHVLGTFEPGDARRVNWIGEVTDINTGTIYYHAFKYKERFGTSTLEYSVVFRLAEQYLIRAEARAQLGDISGSQQDLNMIRTRAGLGNTPAATTNDLLDAILKERQVELFTEQGHRWFDLKRMGKTDAVLSPIKLGWDATDVLLPIPESELLVNPNLLPQNDGY